MKLNTANPKRRRIAGYTLEEVVMSVAIAGIAMTGIINGYSVVARRADWGAVSAAATAQAGQRLEQIRAARWETVAAMPVDEVVAANFPVQTVELPLPKAGASAVQATVRTFVTSVASTPPLKMVRVECVWAYAGKSFTNSLVTYRSPDQ